MIISALSQLTQMVQRDSLKYIGEPWLLQPLGRFFTDRVLIYDEDGCGEYEVVHPFSDCLSDIMTGECRFRHIPIDVGDDCPGAKCVLIVDNALYYADNSDMDNVRVYLDSNRDITLPLIQVKGHLFQFFFHKCTNGGAFMVPNHPCVTTVEKGTFIGKIPMPVIFDEKCLAAQYSRLIGDVEPSVRRKEVKCVKRK